MYDIMQGGIDLGVRDFVKQIESGQVSLIGELEVSDEVYRQLVDYARLKVSNLYMGKTIIPTDITLSIAMVQIAIRHYQQGNYWDYFNEEIGEKVSTSKRSYIGQMFIKTIKEYNLFYNERIKRGNTQYVQNILAHCFVSNAYIEEYFDFIYSFYERNLLRHIPEVITDEVEDLKEYMLHTLSKNTDEIETTLSSGAKTYKLLKSTQTVIAHADTDFLSKILLKHLKMIDDFYYDNVLPEPDNRFAKHFIMWAEKVTENIGSGRRIRRRGVTTIYNRSPYLTIDKESNKGIIILPEQKFRTIASDTQAISLIKTRNENLLKPLSLYRAYGIIVSEKVEIPISDIFGDITVKIKAESIREYSFARKKYRIFDENWNEVEQLKEGKCYILTEKGVTVSNQQNAIIYSELRLPYWNEYAVEVKEDTIIYIDETPLSLTGEFIDSVQFEDLSDHLQLFDMEGKKLTVTNRHPIVSFKVDKTLIERTVIWCNETRYQVSNSNNCRIVELQSDQSALGVTVMLDQLIGKVDGTYVIYVDEPGKTKKLLTQYILLSDFAYEFNKTNYGFYMFNQKGYITLKTNHLIEPLNCKLIDENQYVIDLIQNHEDVKFKLILDDNNYIVNLPIPVFKYKLASQWLVMRPEYYWYKDLTNQLSIYMPKTTHAEVYLKRYPDKRIKGVIDDKHIITFDIHDLVNIIHSSNKRNQLLLTYTDGMNQRTVELVDVLRQIQINDFYLTKKENNIILKVDYVGDADLAVKIKNQKTKETIIDSQYLENGSNIMKELNVQDLYIFEFYMCEDDPFGFGESKRKLMSVFNVGVINYDNLTSCRINIHSIYQGEKRLELRYQYDLRNLTKVGETEYLGTLVGTFRNRRTGKLLDSHQIPNVRMEFGIDETGQLDFSFELNDSEWKEFYYDHQLGRLSYEEEIDYKKIKDIYQRYETLFLDEVSYDVSIRRVK